MEHIRSRLDVTTLSTGRKFPGEECGENDSGTRLEN